MSAEQRDFTLLAGPASEPLASEIGKILKKPIFHPISRFANREFKGEIPQSVRDHDVFIIQSTFSNLDDAYDVNNNYMALFIMNDAAKRAHARRVIDISPFSGYARQDRKDQPRTAITAKLVADLAKASGAHHFITMDIHSDQQEGFFEMAFDNLQGSYCLIPLIRRLNLPNLVFVSPDEGGIKRAKAYNKRLAGKGIVMGCKERDLTSHNKSETLLLIGEAKGYNTVIVDDMIDTAGSTRDVSVLLKDGGAKSIIAVATHGVFSGKALERIFDSPIEKVYITNSIAQPKEVTEHPKIEVISIAPLLAEVIRRVHQGKSISEGLID